MPGCLRAAMSCILSQGLPHLFSDVLVEGGSLGACSCLTKLINSVLMGGQVKVIICHSVTSANVFLSLIVCVVCLCICMCLYMFINCMFACQCEILMLRSVSQHHLPLFIKCVGTICCFYTLRVSVWFLSSWDSCEP